jgi:microcystin-dependent protein
MPSTNGVYSLPLGYLAVTGSTIEASQHNPPLEDIALALTGRLSRDGTAAMSGALQFAPGTVNVPGAVFSNDLTTGFYSLGPGAGIGVAVGGVQIAKFLPGGIVGAREIGELVAYTCTAAPSALWQLPFGQTLSRMTNAALWAQAQIEIAAGNTFYNNGDGSTTFGIGDMRGRLPIGWDMMGGTASGRLTTAGSGVDGTTLGSAGGAQNVLAVQANLPNVNLTFTGNAGTATSTNGGVVVNAFGIGPGTSGGGASPVGGNIVANLFSTFTPTGSISSLNGNVTQTPINKLPPVVVTNYILFAGGAV